MIVLQGRARVFPANISTDDILPGQYLDRAQDEVGQFAMAGVDPEFVNRIEQGDFIVAGQNFGCGSGRESAPFALQSAGIAAIIAPSFGRVFFRNAINMGLPAIMIDATDSITEGAELRVDLEKRAVLNTDSGTLHEIRNLTGTSLDVLQAGGIVPFTKKRIQGEAVEQ